MKKLWGWVSWQKIVFVLILGTVIFQNRIGGGQYLSGWDNLHPEINFGLEVSRGSSAVWQEFRGLGHLGGMGHAADLPRTILLWIVSFVVPSNYLRWAWHMGMLALGPMGMWYLTKKLWKWSESASLVASIFYLLNLATVQYFYTPYESFSAFYGFLTWLIATFVIYLNNGRKNDLIRFAVVSLLATTAFYVQTLFVVYVMMLGIISLTYLRSAWKRVLGAWATLFAINAFWLSPVVYFVVSSAGVVGVSKINSIASPETAYMNEAMGGWRDVLSMKGFWLEYIEWKGVEWGRLLQLWQSWTSVNAVRLLSLLLAGLSILGMMIGAIKKSISWWVIFIFGLTYFMLASNNPPLGNAYGWLTEKIPFFGEMFRSVFTKWSVVMGIVMALGIGAMIESMPKKWLANIFAILIIVISGYIVWPITNGNLVFNSMKVEFPSSYGSLYNFFEKEDKSGRIAYLPSAWAWGWQYHDWGYRGSGFLWYGIEQPILDRAFDVWSPYNEGFYNEFSTALYGGSREDVGRVLSKYDVRYVLLDESVIAPGQDKKILRIEETKKLASELGWEKKFNEGFLVVWETPYGKPDKFVSAPTQYTFVSGDTTKTRKDVIYDDVGSYASSDSQQFGRSADQYPFANLMREEVKNVEWGEQGTTIRSDLAGVSPTRSDLESRELVIPGWEVGEIVRVDFVNNESLPAYYVNGDAGPRFLGDERPKEGESYLYARVSEGEEWEEYRKEQKFEIRSEKLEVEVRGEPFVYDFGRQGQGSIGNCDVLKRGRAEKQGSTYIADERGAVCDYVVMDEPFTRVPHLMRVVGENKAGRSLKFFLYNTGSERNDIEYLMNKSRFDQTFSLLPWDWDGHYSLNIETRSFGQYAENRVEKVEVRYAPIEKIARATVKRSDQEVVSNQNKLEITHAKKTGTWLYGLGVKGPADAEAMAGEGGLIRLSQGYDVGWVGVQISNPKFSNSQILEHVKVDGWANGWLLGGGESGQEAQVVVIFYWPQLLQYLGFVLLGTTLILVMMKRD